MLELTVAVVLLITFSGLCSVAEAALFSLSKSEAAKSNTLTALKGNISKAVSTIVIFNNLANIAGSIYIGMLAAEKLDAGWFRNCFPYMLTFGVIVFAEILPKNLGQRYPYKASIVFARPLAVTTFIATPAVWCLEVLIGLLVPKPNGVTHTNEAEIKLLTRLGAEEGSIDEDEHVMIQCVFHLDDTLAKDIMTPRVAVVCVRETETIGDVKKMVAECQHSRIPVVGERIDEVKGILLKGDLLRALVETQDENNPVGKHMEEAIFVQQDVRADVLLEIFKTSRMHLAIVLDEYAGMAGVVSLEDVLEVLTGEIMDEYDHAPDLQEEARINGHDKLSACIGKCEKATTQNY